jgi:hypothetical protein
MVKGKKKQQVHACIVKAAAKLIQAKIQEMEFNSEI